MTDNGQGQVSRNQADCLQRGYGGRAAFSGFVVYRVLQPHHAPLQQLQHRMTLRFRTDRERQAHRADDLFTLEQRVGNEISDLRAGQVAFRILLSDPGAAADRLFGHAP